MTLPPLLVNERFVLLDLETTGLSTKKAEPVQIAFAHIDHGQTGLRGYYTVKPACPIDEGAMQKHGYTEEKLAHSPAFEHIAHDLLQIIGDRVVLGWGVKRFDIPILKRMLYETTESSPEFRVLDVLLWDKKVGPDRKHSLGVAAEHWGIPLDMPHDAWHDCRAAWGIFCCLAAAHPEVGNATIEEALT
jgi:DNA polymerase-3 subunit epsilon